MESLFETHATLINQLEQPYMRGFGRNIDWNDRLMGILGSRGVGKTTIILQHIKNTFGNDPRCLYVSMDNLYFTSNTLLGFADEFHKKGGKYLFLDEIHKYSNWSQELKNIFDIYRGLKVVFTGSSLLHIHRGKADLSRRTVVYSMEGLSFREFLEIETGNSFPVVTLSDIMENHREIAAKIVSKIKPLAHFSNYLKFGYYPFFMENRNTYSIKLLNTVNLSVETDIPFLNNMERYYIEKLKKLLYLLATSVPFQPNITKLSESIETSRQTTLLYLEYLKDARLVYLLKPYAKGYSYLSKPEKIYLHNSNLMYSLAPGNINTGSLRETFFCNQLAAVANVESHVSGDFTVNNKYVFEVGGKGKSYEQIKGIKNAFIAADMIEYGEGNKIPLWLFGFLY